MKDNNRLASRNNGKYYTVKPMKFSVQQEVRPYRATTAAVTEKVWGEYVASVCQILAK